MAATFSWAQYTGSNANSTTPANLASPGLTPTSSSNSMSWDFETADSTGTVSYTQNPVSAGSASYPVWLKGYWTNSVAYTVSNIKFWQFAAAASGANTSTFSIFGLSQASYSFATGSGLHSNFASNSLVPTSAQSTASPAGALSGFGSFGSNAGTTGVMPSYLCLQLSASNAAPAGTSGYFAFTLQYDEQ